MKTAAKIAAFVIGTLAAGVVIHVIIYAILCSAPQENTDRVNATVKAVCDYARETINGESEEACGIAQDQSNTEYLCRSVNSTADCWVERKGEQ